MGVLDFALWGGSACKQERCAVLDAAGGVEVSKTTLDERYPNDPNNLAVLPAP